MKITLTLPQYLAEWLGSSDFPDSSDITGNALASLMAQYIESKTYPAREAEPVDIDASDADTSDADTSDADTSDADTSDADTSDSGECPELPKS